MSQFTINYSNLENTIYKKAYKLDEVKDKIEKVAFDVVRFKDDDNESNLWQIQNADDGDYIVAMYEPTEEKVSNASNWAVSINKISGDLQFYYNSDHLVSMACNKLGIPESEINKVTKYLPEKLANNKTLVTALLNQLSQTAKNEVLNKYPELV
jgi:hypothetical protein